MIFPISIFKESLIFNFFKFSCDIYENGYIHFCALILSLHIIRLRHDSVS